MECAHVSAQVEVQKTPNQIHFEESRGLELLLTHVFLGLVTMRML